LSDVGISSELCLDLVSSSSLRPGVGFGLSALRRPNNDFKVLSPTIQKIPVESQNYGAVHGGNQVRPHASHDLSMKPKPECSAAIIFVSDDVVLGAPDVGIPHSPSHGRCPEKIFLIEKNDPSTPQNQFRHV
jgi:hypothetical protein